MKRAHLLSVVALVILVAGTGLAQLTPAPSLVRNHPAIAYGTTEAADPVARLNERLRSGAATLELDPGPSGYLRSVLAALDVPVESQTLVFSKTSFQAAKINPQNPRALYFNDSVAVGWVRGGDVLEFIGQDPRQGGIFYTLKQSADTPPQFERNDAACVSCHVSEATRNVPGPFVGSVYPAPNGTTRYGPAYMTDHRSPFDIRYGGWYVNGQHRATRHMGNAVAADPGDLAAMITSASVHVQSLEGRFDPAGYPSLHSDIVALVVLEHQAYMSNLITQVGWMARLGKDAPLALHEAVTELVDYLLFVDEQALPGPIAGPTRFAEVFARQGPFDSRGRSLRQLDLETRLLRYPCSYMIYSDAFESLPGAAKTAIYSRLWDVLTGRDADPRYARLTADDRRAVLEILRDTKDDLPSHWTAPDTY
jgi:hypothetical protein